MSQEIDRREFLTRTAQASAGAAALGVLGGYEIPEVLAARRGGTLRIGVAQGLIDADPHTTSYLTDTQYLQNIFRGLTVRDPKTLRARGDIAESWHVSGNALVWTFKLRPGIHFHNGRELVAEDVKFSIDRILNPATKATAASYFDSVARVQVLGKHTVAFHLKHPFSILDESLLQPYSAIVPKEAVETLKTHPIGSGPFEFVSQVKNTSVTMKKFSGYWQKGLPIVDELFWQVIPTDSAKVAALVSKQVDFITSVPMEQYKSLATKSGVKVVKFQSTWVDEFGMHCRDKPFNGVHVRQAIALALNKKDIAKAATFGLGGPMNTMVAPGWPIKVNVVNPFPYNPTKAKKFLREAGYPHGFDLTFSACGGTAYPQMLRASQVIANQLQQIGINASAPTMDAAVWGNNVVSTHKYKAFVCGLVAGLDADQHTYPYFLSTGNYNFSEYPSTPKLDRLLKLGRETRDPAKRSKIYSQAWQFLALQVPWIPLYWVPGIVAMRSNVTGWVPYPEFDMHFETAHFKS